MMKLSINGLTAIAQSAYSDGGNIALFNNGSHIATKHVTVSGEAVAIDGADKVKANGRQNEIFDDFILSNRIVIISLIHQH